MKKIFIMSILLVVTTVISGQTKSEKKRLKEVKAQKEYLKTKTLINSKNFVFEGEWAIPSAGGNISLIGNANSLKVVNDSVDAYLPYFGIVHSGVAYSGSGGLKFKNQMKDYEIKYDDKKKRITLKFKSKNNSERFDVVLNVYHSGNSSLSVTGSNRRNIRYEGKVVGLD